MNYTEYPWSKYVFDSLGYHALSAMRLNRAGYHNEDHIREMFTYLQENNAPYDKNLDAAILYHDTVYDEFPKKEARSVELFLRNARYWPEFFDVEYDVVARLIMQTVDHKIENDTPESDRWIIRADLHGLAKGETTLMNYIKIMNESKYLYGVNSAEFAKANITFMEGLSERCVDNAKTDPEYRKFWIDVLCGISETIDISRMLLRA